VVLYVHDELMFYCGSFGLGYYFWYEFALSFNSSALVESAGSLLIVIVSDFSSSVLVEAV